ETESEKLSRQKKKQKKEYMRAYRRKIKDYETGEEKQARLIKQNVQKWNSRQKKEDNTFDVIKPVGKFTAKKKPKRQRVSCALHWLVQHNPVYKDITIDYELLAFLPSDGIPTELRKIYCTENSKDDEIDPDRGPLDEIPFNEDTELSSTILNPVQLKPQKQLI
ncbi:unnamed protein product, partial [Pocillopora meandrina]